MSEKISTEYQHQLTSFFKTMSIVGLLVLLLVILNYTNGSKNQTHPTPSKSQTPSPEARNSVSLSSMLANQYFPSEEVKSSNLITGGAGEKLLENESVVNSRIGNMLQVLEYEKLKTFLRKFSMKTIRRLRKLITTNPDEGQRYLVKLVQKESPYITNKNDDGLPSLTIDNQNLIKIATVIFEPEFLEMAELDKADYDDDSLHDLDQSHNSLIQGQESILSFLTTTPEPATVRPSKFYVPYFSQSPVPLYRVEHTNTNVKLSQDPREDEDFRPSDGTPVRAMPPPMVFPTMPTFPPSLNYNLRGSKGLPNRKLKPVVEFVQVVKSPSNHSRGQAMEMKTQSQSQQKRHPVSFHISSILKAQNQAMRPQIVTPVHQHDIYYDHYDDSAYDTYRNQWTNSDSGLTANYPDYQDYGSPPINPYINPRGPDSASSDDSRWSWTNQIPSAQKLNRIGTVGVQSPYDSSYVSQNGYTFSKPIESQVVGPLDGYTKGPPPQLQYTYQPQTGALSYQNFDDHPFYHYGNGELNLHVNHFADYPSVPQTHLWGSFSRLVNETKSVVHSVVQKLGSSTGPKKVLEVSLSSLPFLAFGSYISILLLRALVPSLFLAGAGENATLSGIAYGRSLDVRQSQAGALLDDLESKLKLSIQKFIESMAIN